MGTYLGGRPLIKRGEIYWADFNGSVGSEIRKRRPAVIISCDAGNMHSSIVTVLPLTTSIERLYPFEVFLRPGILGNAKACKVKANQIRTMDKSRLGKCLGMLPPLVLRQVEEALLLHLGIRRP